MVIAAVGVLWCLLWLLGFPPPYRDDPFFVGAGIELFENGRLANPLLRLWNPVASDRYFLHGPFHSWVVAGWLDVFGLSSASLRALQCLLGAVSSLGIMALLRRHGFAGAGFVPFFVAGALLDSGLRHDNLGLALLSVGLLAWGAERAVARALGAWLICCAVITWPILIAYAAPLALALSRSGAPSPSWRSFARRRALPAAVGGTAALASFAVLIQGELSTFLADYTWHVGMVKRFDLLAQLRHQFTHGYSEITFLPTYVVFLVVGAIAGKCGQDGGLRARRFLLVLATGLLAALLLYVLSFHVTAALACWIGIVAFIGEIRRGRLQLALTIASGMAFLGTQGYTAVRLLATDWKPSGVEVAQRTPIPSGYIVGVDAAAARFAFDYKLPDGAFLWSYGAPPTAVWPPRRVDLPARAVLVVSTDTRDIVERRFRAPVVEVFGRKFNSLPLAPNTIVVVP